MANEATYAAFAAMIPNIYAGAVLTARQQSVIVKFVNTLGGGDAYGGLAPRVLGTYSGGTVQTLAETDDLTAQAWAATPGGTITPTIKGAMYFINDTLVASDPNGAARDAATDLGNMLAQKVDVDLASLFSSFTGGTVGTAGGTLTWANVMRAAAYLRAQLAPAPYACILRPEQWYYLTSASSGVPTLLQSQNFMNDLYAGIYVGSISGIDFGIDANVTSGTAAVGGMFSRQAIAYDERRGIRIETQRDASRGGGGNELDATIIYGQAIQRAKFGVQLLGTSA
jgi:hypothetical protein